MLHTVKRKRLFINAKAINANADCLVVAAIRCIYATRNLRAFLESDLPDMRPLTNEREIPLGAALTDYTRASNK